MVRTLLALAVVGTLLSLALVTLAVQAWTERLWTLAGRVHFSIVTLAALMGSGLWLLALDFV